MSESEIRLNDGPSGGAVDGRRLNLRALLQEMIDKDGGAEVTCTFCAKKYHFDGKELSRILDRKSNSARPAGGDKPKPGIH